MNPVWSTGTIESLKFLWFLCNVANSIKMQVLHKMTHTSRTTTHESNFGPTLVGNHNILVTFLISSERYPYLMLMLLLFLHSILLNIVSQIVILWITYKPKYWYFIYAYFMPVISKSNGSELILSPINWGSNPSRNYFHFQYHVEWIPFHPIKCPSPVPIPCPLNMINKTKLY